MTEHRVALRILAAASTALVLTVLAGCRPDGVWSGDSSRVAIVVRGQLLTYDVLVSTEAGKPVRRVTIPVSASARSVKPSPRKRQPNG